jgi:hypothetical protein
MRAFIQPDEFEPPFPETIVSLSPRGLREVHGSVRVAHGFVEFYQDFRHDSAPDDMTNTPAFETGKVHAFQWL